MTYTQQTHTGKRVKNLLRQIRARCVRLWLRFAGPRWTVGCLALMRDERGRVCLFRHRGRVKPWGLPGGLIAWPESPEQGLRRELREELDWDLTLTGGDTLDLSLQSTCVSENFSMLELVFLAQPAVPEAVIQKWTPQASEIAEICWFSIEEIKNLEGILERHRAMLLAELRSS